MSLLLADCVAKRFCASECARLIQDQGSRYKVDSRIHSPRFDCCVFLFYSFSAVTFATESPESGRKFKSSACRDSLISRPETKRILGLAFEMTCTALRIGDCDDGVKQAIADKIIDLAKGGGRNPDVLCEQALQFMPLRCSGVGVGRLGTLLDSCPWKGSTSN